MTLLERRSTTVKLECLPATASHEYLPNGICLSERNCSFGLYRFFLVFRISIVATFLFTPVMKLSFAPALTQFLSVAISIFVTPEGTLVVTLSVKLVYILSC